MLFNSLAYLLFLPAVIALYYALRTPRLQNRMLLAASYVFYGWWDVRFLYLIILSTALDYACGLMIERGRLTRGQRLKVTVAPLVAAWLLLGVPWRDLFDGGLAEAGVATLLAVDPLGSAVILAAFAALTLANSLYPLAERLNETTRRRLFLTISVAGNLSILAAFKYFDFFIESAEAIIHGFGFDPGMARLNIILPVGISFYTFQTMSYTIDIYRRRVQPTDRFLDLALYVAYFPQLVAGPIERAERLLPVLLAPRRVTWNGITRGLYLILLGLFKKVAIADGVARSVDSIYSAGGPASAADVTIATLLFAVQIYCDFSGYSDIARGSSKLMGIDLMVNFRLPYFSKSPSEFWQRWHISLSSWLRDYLYIPLGGNRGSTIFTCRNLMLTMILGGLWHGAAWNFVLWGLYQGLLLVIYRMGGSLAALRPLPTAETRQPRAVFGLFFFSSALSMFSVVNGAFASRIRSFAAWALFFILTCYGWLLFRAESFDQIARFTGALASFADAGSITMLRPSLAALAGLPLLIVMDAAAYRRGSHWYRALPAPFRGALYAGLLFILLMGTSNEPVQFIYFQF